MNRYLLQPEDELRVLFAQNGAEAAVQIFCGRSMIFFPVSAITDLRLQKQIFEDGACFDALSFTAEDTLLRQAQTVLIPVIREDYEAFYAALRKAAPTLPEPVETAYQPERCHHDGKGRS